MVENEQIKFIENDKFVFKVYNRKINLTELSRFERIKLAEHLVLELGFDRRLLSNIMERNYYYFYPDSGSIHAIKASTGSMPSNFRNSPMEEVLFDDLLANNNKQELLQNEIIALLGENKNKVFNFNEIHDTIVENAQELVINTLDYLVDKKLLKEVIENNETKYTLK